MGFIRDLFASTDTSAQDLTLQTNRERQAFITEKGQLAAADLNRLFPASIDALGVSAQSAIDFLQDSEGRRISPLQEGSLRAQQTQLAGLDQIQNAILGQPIDLSQLRASNISVPEQTPVTIPDFNADVLGGQDLFQVGDPQVQAPGQVDISGLTPHRDHFHDASGRKLSASEVLSLGVSFTDPGQQAISSALGGQPFGLGEFGRGA